MGVCMTKTSAPQGDYRSECRAVYGLPRHPLESRPGRSKGDGIYRTRRILSNPEKNILDFYEIDQKLGQGAFGSVSLGINRNTNAEVAIKQMSKGNIKHAFRFNEEIDIMKAMDHPNIVKLHETFENERHVFLAMECCSGGELLERILEDGTFSEKDAAAVMQQMFSALFHMHASGIAHRDVKPENFLFSHEGPIAKNTLKLIDFGVSRRFRDGILMHTKVGTPYYVAPQVIQGSYDKACDLWSCGVVMYTMLVGYPPFSGRTEQDVLKQVSKGSYSFYEKEWRCISEEAKSLIRRLLEMNPAARTAAQEALQDMWIQERSPSAKSVPLSDGLMRNLRSFISQNKLKKAALNIIAGQLCESELEQLKQTFQALDLNGDGFLTLEELQLGMAKADVKKAYLEDLEALLEGVDVDGSGVIDYTEFLAAALDKKLYLQRDVCWAAFNLFDQDCNGVISLEELRSILESGEVEEVMEGRAAEDLLKEADSNGDGEIDFEEFMNVMRAGNSLPLDSISSKLPREVRASAGGA